MSELVPGLVLVIGGVFVNTHERDEPTDRYLFCRTLSHYTTLAGYFYQYHPICAPTNYIHLGAFLATLEEMHEHHGWSMADLETHLQRNTVLPDSQNAFFTRHYYRLFTYRPTGWRAEFEQKRP